MKKKFTKCLAALLAVLILLPTVAVSADVGDYNYYETEPNSTTSNAKRIYSDSTVSGSLYDYDLDYFKFVLYSSQKVTLLVQSTSSRVLATINSSSDTVLYAGTSSYSNGYYYDTITKTLSAGTYYICLLNDARYYSTSYLFYFDYESAYSHTHSYSKKVTKPTCTAQGYTTYTCSCGDSYKSNYVSSTGHDYTETVKKPTCTQQGYTTYSCSCGYSYTTDYTPTEHTLVNGSCIECSYTEWNFETSGDTVIITGYTGNDEMLFIPSEMNNSPVVGIGENAFSNNTNLLTLTIPDSITNIADTAFSGCSSNLKLRINKNNVYAIDFANTNGLNYIVGPYTVTFKNYNGTVLSTKEYYMGDTVTAPKTASRPASGGVAYKFTGWDKTLSATCQGDATYTAKFSAYPALSATSKVTAALTGYDDVKVSWNKVTNADAYRVYYRTSASKTYTYKGITTKTSMNFKDLADNTTYLFMVKPCKKISGQYATDDSYNTTYIKTACNLSAPSKVTAALTGYDDVKVSWNKVTNANAYRVYYRTSSSKTYTYKGVTTKTSMNFKDLADNTTYLFMVKPCKKVNGSYFTDDSYNTTYIKTSRDLSAPSKVTAVLYGYDDVKVSWSKVSNAKAYKVYYKSATAKTYTLKTTTTKLSYNFANLADGTQYIFKVVPCTYIGGKYIADDSAKTASCYTLKKIATPKVTAASKTSVKVSWTNIGGESGYQISQSTSKTSTKIVSTYSTTSGGSKTLTAQKGKTYYYKVRAYKTVNGTKIYGPWSAVASYNVSNSCYNKGHNYSGAKCTRCGKENPNYKTYGSSIRYKGYGGNDDFTLTFGSTYSFSTHKYDNTTFVRIPVTVKNNDNVIAELDWCDFDLSASNNSTEYDGYSSIIISRNYFDDGKSVFSKVRPGASVSGAVYIPYTGSGYYAIFLDGLDDVIIEFYVK